MLLHDDVHLLIDNIRLEMQLQKFDHIHSQELSYNNCLLLSVQDPRLQIHQRDYLAPYLYLPLLVQYLLAVILLYQHKDLQQLRQYHKRQLQSFHQFSPQLFSYGFYCRAHSIIFSHNIRLCDIVYNLSHALCCGFSTVNN